MEEKADKLFRLRQELGETISLLKSPRVKGMTRYVLERLRDDLQRQVAHLQKADEIDSGTDMAAD